MYSLRTISKGGGTTNFCLGNQYTVYRKNDVPYEREAFNREMKIMYEGMTEKDIDNSETYCIVSSEHGERINLYRNNWYYIVMSNGNTYENLTKK